MNFLPLITLTKNTVSRVCHWHVKKKPKLTANALKEYTAEPRSAADFMTDPLIVRFPIVRWDDYADAKEKGESL